MSLNMFDKNVNMFKFCTTNKIEGNNSLNEDNNNYIDNVGLSNEKLKSFSFLQDQDLKIYLYLKNSTIYYKKLNYDLISLSFELSKENSDSTLINDEIQRINNQIYKLSNDIDIFNSYNNCLIEISNCKDLLEEADELLDKELIDTVNNEIKQHKTTIYNNIDEFLDGLFEEDQTSRIFLEIRSASGGIESMLFAQDILEMYKLYCENNCFDWKEISFTEGENATRKSCKSAKIQITGHNVYTHFKLESGVHKVQRVPITESKGRIHSSTCSVVILKDTKDDFKSSELNERDLKYEFMRAGGAGGQHVNKTESACRVTHIPSGLQVHISDSREQHINKLRAVSILKTKLNELKKNEFLSKIQSDRKNQTGTGNLSEKIRTYNYPDSRVTDHRLGETFNGINKMMEGNLLNEIIAKLIDKDYNETLNTRLEEMLKDIKMI